MVNGKGPYTFLVDTGGQGKARIDAALKQSLNLPVVGKAQAGDGQGRSGGEFDVVKVDSLKIGDLEFRDIDAMSRDYNSNPNMPKIDGVLCFGLFSDHLLTLDFPGKKLVIAKGSLPAEHTSSITVDGGIPSVPAKIADQPITAHIDTGSMGGISVPAEFAAKLSFSGEPRVMGRARTVGGEMEIKGAQLKGDAAFAGQTLSSPMVVYSEIMRTGNIGMRVLQDFKITFDQKNARVKIEK
jgi:predicted aspartyl protease